MKVRAQVSEESVHLSSLASPAQGLDASIEDWLSRPVPGAGCVSIPDLGAAIATTTGATRRMNQDKAVVAKIAKPAGQSRVVCIICDGISVFANGRAAAIKAIAALLANINANPLFSPARQFQTALEAANAAVYRSSSSKSGTTLTAILFSRDETLAATVGDSRLYVFCRHSQLRQISVDDTIGQQLERLQEEGKPPLKLARLSRRLTNYVGMTSSLDAHYHRLTTEASEMSFVLATDGAHFLGDPILQSALKQETIPSEALRRLLLLSQQCEGPDDASLISISCQHPKSLLGTGIDSKSQLTIWDGFGRIELPCGCA